MCHPISQSRFCYNHDNTKKNDSLKVPSNDDPTLADKEAILASLNIKAMTFDDTIGVLTQSKILDVHTVTCHIVTDVET